MANAYNCSYHGFRYFMYNTLAAEQCKNLAAPANNTKRQLLRDLTHKYLLEFGDVCEARWGHTSRWGVYVPSRWVRTCFGTRERGAIVGWVASQSRGRFPVADTTMVPGGRSVYARVGGCPAAVATMAAAGTSAGTGHVGLHITHGLCPCVRCRRRRL